MAAPRLSLLSDLSMRELGIALHEEERNSGGETGHLPSTANAISKKGPPNGQRYQLGGVTKTLPAMINPNNFNPSERSRSRTFQRDGQGVLKTQYEAITKEGLNTTIYAKQTSIRFRGSIGCQTTATVLWPISAKISRRKSTARRLGFSAYWRRPRLI